MSEMTDERAAEVLAAHNGWRRYNGETGVPGAPEMGDPAELGHAIDHAVSRLRSQPPAEAQPVAWQFQDREGNWHGFVNEKHRLNTIEDGSWPIRALYAHPPPSASVGVEDESVRVGNFPTMNQDGYPGLGEWWVQLWRGDEVIARVYGDGPDEVRSQAQDIADALNQQPAAVDGADAQDAEIEALRVRADAMAGEAIKHEARAERLAEALREAKRLGDQGDWRAERAVICAALHPTAAKEGKESFWPKLPGSGGPDWTGHD